MKYPKINTIWKRDEKNKYRIVEGDVSKPEFSAIKLWEVTEKIDGTNIRITYDRFNNDVLKFDGRGDNAEIPKPLLKYLQETFTEKLFRDNFDTESTPTEIILFGEGYGAGINGGGSYRNDVSFILFDACIDGWWVQRTGVENIASKLGIDVVPLVGIMTIEEAVAFVKSKPMSQITEKDRVIEGIVARSYPIMMFRHNEDHIPIMWKLKVKDYKDIL